MRILIGVLTLVLLATLLTPLVVFGSSHRDYAHSRDSGVSDVTGLRATIETADPFVADEGGFSLGTMWIIGPDDSSGNRQWVEVGWEKDEDGPMRFFSYCAPASQCGGYDYHGNVGAGSSHYYKLEHDTGDDWKFYIDDVEERSETAGFDSGDIVDIGGEVTDPDSDIGVSGAVGCRIRN